MLAIHDYRQYNLRQILKLFMVELVFFALCFLISLLITINYLEHIFYINLYYNSKLLTTGNIVLTTLVFSLLANFCIYTVGLYKKTLNFYLLEQLLRGSMAMLLLFFVLNNLSYILSSFDLGWQVWLVSIVLSYVSLVLLRTIFCYLTKGNVIKTKTVVLGAGNRALTLKNNLSNLDSKYNKQLSINHNNEIVGYIAKPGDRERLTRESIINLTINNNIKTNKLLEYCLDNDIDTIVVAVDDRRNNFPSVQLLECKQHGINVIELMEFCEQEFGRNELDILDPSWIIYSNKLHQSKQQEQNKSSIDRILALSLLTLISPIMLVALLLLKLNLGFKRKAIIKTEQVGKLGLRYNRYSYNCYKISAKNKFT